MNPDPKVLTCLDTCDQFQSLGIYLLSSIVSLLKLRCFSSVCNILVNVTLRINNEMSVVYSVAMLLFYAC